MRKQYYFRSSSEGLLAWDVDRLVLLTNDRHRLRRAALRDAAAVARRVITISTERSPTGADGRPFRIVRTTMRREEPHMERETARAEEGCVFCEIGAGRVRASVIAEDARTLTFLDLRQFHPGHVLVVPRQHVRDLRDVDDATAGALIVAAARAAPAVDRAFPGDGLSVWHSAGEGANQEVPHLHFHVHPRRVGDDVLRVYPSAPAHPDRETLDAWAARIRVVMSDDRPCAAT